MDLCALLFTMGINSIFLMASGKSAVCGFADNNLGKQNVLVSRQTKTEPSIESENVEKLRMPKHVAVIMDGNGRWAQARGLPRVEGHRKGANTVRRISEACRELGVSYLTLYCFSNENWKRPKEELSFLMSLLKTYLVQERPTLLKNDIRLRLSDGGREFRMKCKPKWTDPWSSAKTEKP